MRSQASNEQTLDSGVLYLVPTPIGNLEDMTFRAIRMMKEADVIAAEDTRNTRKLCNHFDINTEMVSYHEHNRQSSGRQLITRLKNGDDVALVSDAGMPCISDPGYELVVLAIEAGIHVIPLPGANAALTALIASGIQPQPFYFYGFLPRGKKDKKAELERLSKQSGALIFYEAPHRLKDTLKAMLSPFGDRKIVLCRELTKKFEQFLRGTLEKALIWAENEQIRGEFCIIIEGNEEHEHEDEALWWASLSMKDHVEHYIASDMSSKEAIKQVAKDRRLTRRDVYQAYHVDKE